MKLIKEYLNEKFTEDGDPITDMGIGYESKFQEYYKKCKKDYGRQNLNNIEVVANLISEIIDNEYDLKEGLKLLDYIVKKKEVDVNESLVYESVVDNIYDETMAKKSIQVLKVLIKNGLNIKNNNDIFIYAVENSEYSDLNLILKFLLKNGANINAGNSQALDQAIYNEDEEFIKFLIKNGIDVTPHCSNLLKYAIDQEDKKLIEIAIRAYVKVHNITL